MWEQLEGPYKFNNSPSYIVEKLCEPLSGSKRNVKFYSWFTSYSLIAKMLAGHGLTTAGILRKNSRFLRIISVCGGMKIGRIYSDFKNNFH
jgi:hypothetical protein